MGRCVAPNGGGKEVPASSPTPSITALQEALPEPTEPAVSPSTETEGDGTMAEPVLEEANEQPSFPAPEPTAENQAEPAPEPSASLGSETEDSSDGSTDMVYVPGFGWIESQGSNRVEYAEDIYKN